MPTEPNTELPPINCLRCRHCVLLKHSNISSVVTAGGEPNRGAIVPIHCKKLKRALPAKIWQPCHTADPRTRWKLTPAGNKVPSGGDKTGASTDVEKAFFAVTYPHFTFELLVELTGRDRLTLLSIAVKRGLKRSDPALERAHREAGAKFKVSRTGTANFFTPEQSVYINARYLAGHQNEGFRGLPPEWVWPRSTYPHAAILRRNRAVKTSIIAEVAKRGPARTWDAIRRHPEWCNPRYQKQQKQRAIKRLVKQRKTDGVQK